MTRRNWTIFAAMFVAALFLVGCGSDGDRGMAGPAGPPGPAGEPGEAGGAGEAPTEEEIETIVEDVIEETGDSETVNLLSMTAGECIMASLGATAAAASKADTAATQAALIKGLTGKGTSDAWYEGMIIGGAGDGVVDNAGLAAEGTKGPPMLHRQARHCAAS